MWIDNLLSSPIFWGIVTLILAAIALSGRVGMNASNILLSIAFLVGCIGIIRMGQEIHLRIILCLVLAIGLTLLSWWITPNLQRSKDKSLIFNEPRFIISSNQLFMWHPFAYKSTNEMTYIIDCFLCIDLVNNTSVLRKISDYYAQIQFNGEWVDLLPVLFSEKGHFYYIQDMKNKTGMSIDFDKKTFEEQLRNKNLLAGETVSALLLFYIKDRKKYALIKADKIKLVLIDSINHEESHIINISQGKYKKEKHPTGWLNPLEMKVIETGIDFKKFNIINPYQ